MKILYIFFLFASLNSVFAQTKYKIEINIADIEDAGTGGPARFTLVGTTDQYDFKIDNESQDDLQRNTKSTFFTPVGINIGKLTDIRIEINPTASGKFIDDIYVTSIRVTDTSTNETTGDVLVEKWIGDGYDGKSDTKVFTSVVDWN